MHEITSLVTKRHGKLEYDQREEVARLVAGIPDGTRLEWVLREVKDTRSARQLRWLFGTAYEMFVEHYGYDLDERREAKLQLHYALLKRCFGSRWDDKIGAEVPNVPASRQLDTKRCSDYMEWLVRYAAREGFVIELPDEFRGVA